MNLLEQITDIGKTSAELLQEIHKRVALVKHFALSVESFYRCNYIYQLPIAYLDLQQSTKLSSSSQPIIRSSNAQQLHCDMNRDKNAKEVYYICT